ncbi:MAG: ferrous iron transporter B, partial [Deltaproteobacteria bacterium]|nr:ferrous iron transporter B [Deltaproteobacteria bacterium]
MTEPGEAARGRRVVVLGNPNVGKTSLWSRLSREHAPVGNYPGITVERREGPLVGLPHVRLADVPGTYSLSARSADEQIAIDAALGLHGEARPDLAVVVLDSGQLARSLYVTVQLLELGVPSVLALNMIDEAGATRPDERALSRELGVPVVATSARTGEGVDALVAAIAAALEVPPRPHLEVRYPDELRAPVDRLAERLPSDLRASVERDRALARWLLTSVDDGEHLAGVPAELTAVALEMLGAPGGEAIDSAIIRARWAHIDGLVARVAPGAAPRAGQRMSERLDGWLLHPVWGFAAFVALMTGLFQGLFSGTEPLVGLIEGAVLAAQQAAAGALPGGLLRDLVVDGVLGGVGNVLV